MVGFYFWTKYSVSFEMISKVPEGIEKVEIEGKGMGIKATKKFDKHEFICEYRGELISKHEAQRREESSEYDSCYMYFFEHKLKKLWYVLNNLSVIKPILSILIWV